LMFSSIVALFSSFSTVEKASGVMVIKYKIINNLITHSKTYHEVPFKIFNVADLIQCA
jgi:hypothetical protein